MTGNQKSNHRNGRFPSENSETCAKKTAQWYNNHLILPLFVIAIVGTKFAAIITQILWMYGLSAAFPLERAPD